MLNNNLNLHELIEEYRPLVNEIGVNAASVVLENSKNIILIDVREDYEWQYGHIATAIHLPLAQVNTNIEQLVSNKANKVILYCAHGYRSILAAHHLHQLGYTETYSLIGGISGWIDAGLRITTK
jgi:rhodanese-related sulfurtransferase